MAAEGEGEREREREVEAAAAVAETAAAAAAAAVEGRRGLLEVGSAGGTEEKREREKGAILNSCKKKKNKWKKNKWKKNIRVE